MAYEVIKLSHNVITVIIDFLLGLLQSKSKFDLLLSSEFHFYTFNTVRKWGFQDKLQLILF